MFEWHASRAARCLDSLLGPGYQGKLQSDGYSAYPAFVKNKAVELFGCWAHARRGFFEALEQALKVAGWILNQIGQMYGWERQLRLSRAGPALRQAHRRSHSRMVVERLDRTLPLLRARYLPKSLMGQAISYALNHWATLARFLDHGEVEIDNNLVENAIRPTALGKNYVEVVIMRRCVGRFGDAGAFRWFDKGQLRITKVGPASAEVGPWVQKCCV